MGHRYAAADAEIVLKLLGAPVWLLPGGGSVRLDQREIRAL